MTSLARQWSRDEKGELRLSPRKSLLLEVVCDFCCDVIAAEVELLPSRKSMMIDCPVHGGYFVAAGLPPLPPLYKCYRIRMKYAGNIVLDGIGVRPKKQTSHFYVFARSQHEALRQVVERNQVPHRLGVARYSVEKVPE